MIKINDKEYNIYNKKIIYGNYSITTNGKTIKGISPVICFECECFSLNIETVYDKKYLNQLEINESIDITKYISDIAYEEEKKWQSLSRDNCSCILQKTENNIFNFNFTYSNDNLNEKQIIYIQENLQF